MTSQGDPSTNKVRDSYHDYAQVTEKDPEFDETSLDGLASSSLSPKEGNFPVKLHCLLSELERDGVDDILSWQPNGRCFVVHKQQDFVEKILQR
jgi:hypothetical protein